MSISPAVPLKNGGFFVSAGIILLKLKGGSYSGHDTAEIIQAGLIFGSKFHARKDIKMTEKSSAAPLISVIVPVYKVEKYLDRCIDSIVNQTYTNLEIILVDDGSPDNCPAMCDKWAEKDSRIKVIHQDNGGLSAADCRPFLRMTKLKRPPPAKTSPPRTARGKSLSDVRRGITTSA